MTGYSRNYKWKLQSRIPIPIGTKRELSSSLFQLKLGHGYLKLYLHRLGYSTSNKCKCGQRETPEHLLLSCKELKEARDKLRKELGGIRLKLPLLLYTKLGIEKTLGFLKETRIATRSWHLERRREEEQEEGLEEELEEEERGGG